MLSRPLRKVRIAVVGEGYGYLVLSRLGAVLVSGFFTVLDAGHTRFRLTC